MKRDQGTMSADPGRARKLYALAVLAFAYFLYALDRNAIVVTQELWKAEFRLSDSQVGLLTGAAYGVSYALGGLPMGWAADRFNRRTLLASLVAIWSALTAANAFAGSFIHLMLLRVGTGLTEAGAAPASLSILSDTFSTRRRATVVSLFFASTGIGALVSFLAGSWIAAEYGWRAVLLICGIPGLALALLILFTLKEPVRTHRASGPALPLARVPAAAIALLATPPLGAIYIGSTLCTLTLTSYQTWIMSFLVRSHHIGMAQAGQIVGIATGGFAILGLLLGGLLADGMRRFGPGGPLRLVAAAAILNMSFGLGALISGSMTLVVICICGFGATSTLYSAATNATLSEIAPAERRGLSFALFALLANLVGAGLGPVLVGAIADLLKSADGTGNLGAAIALVLSLQIVAALAYMVAAARLSKGQR